MKIYVLGELLKVEHEDVTRYFQKHEVSNLSSKNITGLVRGRFGEWVTPKEQFEDEEIFKESFSRSNSKQKEYFEPKYAEPVEAYEYKVSLGNNGTEIINEDEFKGIIDWLAF